MSEEIKAGEMVWAWLDGINEWSSEKYELRAVGNEAFAYSDGERLHATHEVTTIDPHKPKAPEWMPEGCELWEYSEGKFTTKAGTKLSLDEMYYGSILHRLNSFALEAENGNIVLCNSPLQFTRDDCICEQLINNTWKRAKILGAVMYLEAKQDG